MDLKFSILAIFFLQISRLSALLEPPSNVTLHCKNLHNILKWNYSNITPGLRFRVDINSDQGLNGCHQPLWLDIPLSSSPPPLQADVSCFSDPKVSYYLTVTAVNGDTASARSPEDGITFSYYKASFAEQKCYVDLPLFNIASKPQSQAEFQFEHPCLLYHQKLPECDKSIKEQGDLLHSFKYKAVVVSTGEIHRFECIERVCKEMLTMNDEQEFCLMIEGELETMPVKPTQDHYCVTPQSPPNYTYIFIGVSVVTMVVGALIFFMVYHKFTQPSSPLPTFIEHSIRRHHPLNPVQDPADQFSIVDQEPSSPTPLLPTTEEDVQGNVSLDNESVGDDLRLQIGITMGDDEAPGNTEQNIPNGLRSPYMDGNDLEGNDGEAVPSSYEIRAAVV